MTLNTRPDTQPGSHVVETLMQNWFVLFKWKIPLTTKKLVNKVTLKIRWQVSM